MIDVCSDASVAFMWFIADGEDEAEVAASRALVRSFMQDAISLWILDLTRYEVGNAGLLGHAHAPAEQLALMLDALARTCPTVTPSAADLRYAAMLAEKHRLTVYDATYAAVARSRGAQLATLDKALLKAGLGRRPSEIVDMVQS